MRKRAASINRIRAAFPNRAELLRANLQLQKQLAALMDDNRQLRAALRIFGELARNSPAGRPGDGGRPA